MRRLLSSSVFLLVLAALLAAQTGNWKQYESKDGRFTVLFPGDPDDHDTGAGTGVHSHTLVAAEAPALYTVIYANPATPQPVDDATYAVYRDSVFQALPDCKVGPEQPPAPARQGYIGHWYRLDCDSQGGKVLMEGNLYWGARHSYAVMVMFPAGPDQPKPLQRFLESFSPND
ncbi:MAG TPA: hypothetical protein VEG08_11635 [Terriglobales bacterium]|nr:hypothetical protein [Terriglobales bacterium]